MTKMDNTQFSLTKVCNYWRCRKIYLILLIISLNPEAKGMKVPCVNERHVQEKYMHLLNVQK